MIHYRSVDAGGHRVFYREAGDPANPTVLLLHGFPTASHMFRDLIPHLAGSTTWSPRTCPGSATRRHPPGSRTRSTTWRGW